MKTFAKFIGTDENLKTGDVYMIRVYSRDGDLKKLNVRVADSWWCPYSSYDTFKKNWEII